MGQLTWARAVLADMAHSRPTVHHSPLPFSLAIVIATVMAAAGYARMGAGLIVQQQRGLRPSELLKLQRQDVILPGDQFFGAPESAVINLGSRGGTKLKRSQAVLVAAVRHPQALIFLDALCRSTPPHQFLVFGIDLPMYQHVLAQVCAALQLPAFTPHSARAGMATDQFLAGRDFVSICEEGRLTSDASLRVYLDVVASASMSASTAAQCWATTAAYLAKNFAAAFPWWGATGRRQLLRLPAKVMQPAQRLSADARRRKRARQRVGLLRRRRARTALCSAVRLLAPGLLPALPPEQCSRIPRSLRG